MLLDRKLDELVVATGGGNQTQAKVTPLSDGSYLVVWHQGDYAIGGVHESVRVQRYSAAGARIGGETFLNSVLPSGTHVSAPNATALADGGYAVTWIKSDAAGSELRIRSFRADGTDIGSEAIVPGSASTNIGAPAMTALAGGGFVVSWYGSGSGVVAHLFDAAGAPTGAPLSVDGGSFWTSIGPGLAALPDGRFVVTWWQGENGTSEVMARLFNADGTPAGDEFQVNGLTGGIQNAPAIATLENGGFVITWVTNHAGTNDIHAQTFAADGRLDGPETTVNTVTAGSQAAPSVSALRGGGFLVTWTDGATVREGNGATSSAIVAQAFDRTSAKLGTEFLVNTTGKNGQYQSAVAMLPSGDIVAVWTDDSLVGTGGVYQGWRSDIRAQLFKPHGAITDVTTSATGVSEVAFVNQAVATLGSNAAINGGVRYEIVADFSGGAFRIVGNQLVVASNAHLDFESAATVRVTVRAIEAGGISYEEQLSFTVANSAGEMRFIANDAVVSYDLPSTIEAATTDAVVRLASGQILLVVQERINNVLTSRAQYMDETGARIGGSIALTDVPQGGIDSLVALADGGFAAAWKSPAGYMSDTRSEVMLQRFDASGQALGAPVVINSTIVGDQYMVQLATLGDGNLIAVWRDDQLGGQQGIGSVRAQIFAPSGDRVGGEITLPIDAVMDGAFLFKMAALPTGFILTWHQNGSAPDYASVNARLFDNAGAPLGGQFVVSTTTRDLQSEPSVGLLSSGRFVISWTDDSRTGGDFSNSAIKAQMFEASGVKVGGEFLVNSVTLDEQTNSSVIALPTGGFIISWIDHSNHSSTGGSRPTLGKAQIFTESGARVGTEFQLGELFGTHIVAGASGSWLAFWNDNALLTHTMDTYVAARSYRLVTPGTAGADTLTATAGADILEGLGGDDRLSGNAGDDLLNGGDGNDVLAGGAGRDILNGGAGDDTLYSHDRDPNYPGAPSGPPGVSLDIHAEPDQLSGGDGNDVIFAGFGDSVDGGADDLLGDQLAISFFGATAGIAADFRLLGSLASITIGGATITAVEEVDYIEGSNFDDLLAAWSSSSYAGRSTIHGRGGNDHLFANIWGSDITGGTGNDVLEGNRGSDTLHGDDGDDVLDGGGFNDLLYGGVGNDQLYGAADLDIIEGGDGDDLLYGDYSPIAAATDYASVGGIDVLRGGAGADRLYGDGGHDHLEGGDGDDILEGGTGDDRLEGGDGHDRLVGGVGIDQFVGGRGNDVIIATHEDSVVQAGDGDDRVEYSGGTSRADTPARVIDLGAGTDHVVLDYSNFTTSLVTNLNSIRSDWVGVQLEVYADPFGLADRILQVRGYESYTLLTGTGNDTAIVGRFAEVHSGAGDDRITSERAGSQWLFEGASRVDGGAGIDAVFISWSDLSAAQAVVWDLADPGGVTIGTEADERYLRNVEILDRFASGAGNDIITFYAAGRRSSQLVESGAGDDTVTFRARAQTAEDEYISISLGDGDDHLIVDFSDRSQSVIANGTYHASGNLAVSTRDYERKTVFGGAGDDSFAGDSNAIYHGNAGNDIFILGSGGGSNQAHGGAGSDRLALSLAGSTLIIPDTRDGAGGYQGVLATQSGSVTYTSIESFTVYGNFSAADTIVTGEGDDIVYGDGWMDVIETGAGNDYLDGGTQADTMRGGTGEDVYIVDNLDDVVSERDGEGVDEIHTALADYVLPENVERLVFTGTAPATLRGNAADNSLSGSSAGDLLDLRQGGDDSAAGGAGDDQIYYGASFTAADVNDGGSGTDVVILQGDYLTALAAASLVGVEFLSLQSGSSTRYGEAGTSRYDYDLTFVDANIAAGQRLTINASQLLAGESFTFDGSAETDGHFLVYGGYGDDDVTGGTRNDLFHFEGTRWGAGDVVDGGAGADALIIRGGSGLTSIIFGEAQVRNIESITVSDRFGLGGAGRPSYDLTLASGNVTPGGSLILNGSTLLDPGQTFNVDGSAITDGNLRMFGGAGGDRLIGGAGNDFFYAAGGQDVVTGGAGADSFQLRSLADSALDRPDRILDFASGTDKLDLRFLDADANVAGDQPFSFIGAAAFGQRAGELRAYDSGLGHWLVEGDVDGDGLADFAIEVTLPAPAPLVSTDFVL